MCTCELPWKCYEIRKGAWEDERLLRNHEKSCICVAWEWEKDYWDAVCSSWVKTGKWGRGGAAESQPNKVKQNVIMKRISLYANHKIMRKERVVQISLDIANLHTWRVNMYIGRASWALDNTSGYFRWVATKSLVVDGQKEPQKDSRRS